MMDRTSSYRDLGNYDAMLDLSHSHCAKKDKIVEYVNNHRFKCHGNDITLANQCYDLSSSSPDVSMRKKIKEDISKTLKESNCLEYYFRNDPPNVLSGKNYTFITDSQGNIVSAGDGSYVRALLAKDNKTNSLVVVKLVRTKNSHSLDVLMEEYALTRLAHQVLKDGCYTPHVKGLLLLKENELLGKHFFPYVLVQEYAGLVSGFPVSLSVDEALQESKKGNSLFSEVEWEEICLKVVHGADQFRDNNITHIDIHPKNVLIQLGQEELKIVFIDFGISVGNWNYSPSPVFSTKPAKVFPQTAPALYELPKPLPTTDLYSCAYLIQNVASATGNSKLEQEMQKYRSKAPEERTVHLYSIVEEHIDYRRGH